MYKSSMEQLNAYANIVRLYLSEYLDAQSKGTAFTLSESGRETVDSLYREITEKSALSEQNGIFLPLEYICRAFGLSQTERLIIVLAILPFTDKGDCGEPSLTGGANLKLALRLFENKEFSVQKLLASPLFKYILEPYNEKTLDTPLRLRRYFSMLLFTGEFVSDYRYMSLKSVDVTGVVCYQKQYDEILSIMRHDMSVLVCLEGKKGSGRKRLLVQCARELSLPVLFISFKEYAALDDMRAAGLDIACELIMWRCFACVTDIPDDFDKMRLSELFSLLQKTTSQFYAITEEGITAKIAEESELAVYPVKIGELSLEKRAELWLSTGLMNETNALFAANRYNFTPKQIANAAAYADAKLCLLGKQSADEAVITESCRALCEKNLAGKAELIESKFTMNDLILPKEEKQLLAEACAHIRHRRTVFDKWNFASKLDYGKGLSMLFEGPPGTGKTMAAAVIAQELGIPIYKADISKIVSKYIGETEKSLSEIFEQAHRASAALFFDETDALFGKRSEIKDSHDRYANIETSFLLQRLESFDGVVIMATNLVGNIDEAFMRRINYVVHFPFPNAEQRLKLWESMFPAEMPRDSDIDLAFLADNFELSGGIIKNTVMSAAFMAAEDGLPVNMTHMLRALKNQLSKQGRVVLKDDFGEYSAFITL